MPETTRIPLQVPLAGPSVVALDDDALLAWFAEHRDEAAFAALVARHGPMVLATARAALGHEQDAEDAFQATFLILARRARSIRRGGTLGAWLHRVAHRSAIRVGRAARRRRRVEAAATPPTAPTRPDPAGDRGAVHAAIDRLPRPYRQAVILCDLEGLTYAEAAARLGCTPPALRNRLARARGRLRSALGAGDLATPVLATPRVAVADGLLRRAVAAGLRPIAFTPATRLAVELAVRGSLGGASTRARAGAAVLLALASVVPVGLATAGRSWRPMLAAPPASPTPPGQSAATPARSADPPPVVGRGDDTIRGRVVDPAGRPVAGAEVVLARPSLVPRPLAMTRSGPDGGFDLILTAADRQRPVDDPDDPPRLLARAAGFGLGVVAIRRAVAGPATIRLTDDGPAIEGRIIDEAGRPIAGAEVGVFSASLDFVAPAAADPVANWNRLAAERNRFRQIAEAAIVVPIPPRAVTDGDGRFSLRGIGPDRVALVRIMARGHVIVEAPVVTADGVDEVFEFPGDPDRLMRKVHPYSYRILTQALAPARPVGGVIRDFEDGRPIEGVAVWARAETVAQSAPAEATTDAAGQFQLEGLPRSESYGLTLLPPVGRRYPRVGLTIGEGSGLEDPISVAVKLRRLVVLRGRATDAVTGRPIFGRVVALPCPGAPEVTGYPGFDSARGESRPTDADGRYELLVSPGRCLLAFDDTATPARRRVGQGGEQLPGYDPEDRRLPPTAFHASIRVASHLAWAILDVPPGAETATFDLRVQPDLPASR